MSAAWLRDYWHVVAGSLEERETSANAAARDLREETGLVGQPIDMGLAVVIANFHVEVPDGWEPTLNEEHDRHDWATFDDARTLMYWPETQEAIDVLIRRV